MKNSFLLNGLFPETLPPCFTSKDCHRAFRGLSSVLATRRFHKKREAPPVLYSGTKHDGSRRLYATPHVIPYYYISDFVVRNWKTFDKAFNRSPYSVSTPRQAIDDTSRAIVVTPLSEVPTQVSIKIRYAPFILRADIAQFYSSVYTHTISWAAHGKVRAKGDRRASSSRNRFNQLDFFVQNAQSGQTKGLLIGPDAYRVIAELIAVQVNQLMHERCNELIVGAARHVDDFYIGVRSETDALAVLAHLRDALHEYELNVNDLKTRITAGVAALDDPWASRLRLLSNQLAYDKTEERIISFLDEAVSISRQMETQSPVKPAVRRADRHALHRSPHFEYIEPYLQRMVYHFPHAIDYICLFVVKRFATGGTIDQQGWAEVINSGLLRHQVLGNHHESCWLSWLGIVCGIAIAPKVISEVSKQNNQHLLVQIIQASMEGKCERPQVRFAAKIPSDDKSWLTNMVARSSGFINAPFSGCYVDECEHLAGKRLSLIDFNSHVQRVAVEDVRAIANVRFGYEDEDGDEAPSVFDEWSLGD